MKYVIVYGVLVIYFLCFYWPEKQYVKDEAIDDHHALFLYKMILYGLGIGGLMLAANFLIQKIM